MADLGESRVGKVLIFLGQLFGIFGGGVARNVKRALETLRGAIVEIGEELVNYMRETGKLLARLVGALRRVWSRGLVPLLQWLRKKYLELQGWLKRTLAPLVRVLNRIRKEWRQFRDKYIQPILDVLSMARVGLRILRTVGVDWARKLDETLARLEGWIVDAVRAVETRLTKAENVLDRVITLDFLLQRFALIRSLDRDGGFWIRQWWNKQIVRTTTIPPRDPTRPKYSRRQPSVDLERWDAYLTRQAGPFAPVIDEMGDQLEWVLGVRPGLTVED